MSPTSTSTIRACRGGGVRRDRRGVSRDKSRHGENAAVLAPLEPCEAEALVDELARCRTVTPDEAIALEACRRLWAENRQRFFVSAKSPNLSDLPASTAATKSQERIPQHEVEPNGSR